MLWAVGAAVGLAALGIGCSNKIVARAPVPSAITTTSLPSLAPTYPKIQSDSQLAIDALNANLPTPAEIAGTSIGQLRTRALAAIDARLTSLNSATALLAPTTHLTAAELAAENSEIGGAVQSLNALKAAITAEANLVIMRRDVGELTAFTNVGTVILPKVSLLVAADQVLRGDDGVSLQVPALEKRIADAQAHKKQVGPAQAALANLQAQSAEVVLLARGLLQSVPTITTAQISQIAAGQPILGTAKADLANAQSDVGLVSAALQAAV